jgi:aspartate aminotransferase
MISIAERMKAIKASLTLTLTQRSAELKKSGVDVIGLSAGEPDFPTPPWICSGALKAIDQGQTRYTPVGGTPELKQAIIEKFLTDQGLSYGLSEVMASTGGKQVIFNGLLATLNPGDEVILPSPYWVSYEDIIHLGQGSPVIVPCFKENQFKLTPQALQNAITPRTKWLILNSPNNPTGMVYSPGELYALAQVLEKHPHIWILSDDIYEYIIYEGTFKNIVQVMPSLKSRTLIVNGLSKSYNMTGWRLGYGAGPQELIEAMTNLQSHSTSNPCSITQGAAIAALKGPKDFIKDQVATFKERRDLAFNILSCSPFFDCIKPQGAFYMYVDCTKALGYKTPQGRLLHGDQEVADYLLEQGLVALVPGCAFGFSPYLRLSYALETSVLKTACLRIVEALSKLETYTQSK